MHSILSKIRSGAQTLNYLVQPKQRSLTPPGALEPAGIYQALGDCDFLMPEMSWALNNHERFRMERKRNFEPNSLRINRNGSMSQSVISLRINHKAFSLASSLVICYTCTYTVMVYISSLVGQQHNKQSAPQGFGFFTSGFI